MMIEINEENLKDKVNKKETFFLYVYTPICGTCTVSKKMLEIALEIVGNKTVYMINANFAREVTTQFEIQSVPCVVSVIEGTCRKKEYALRNIENTIHILKTGLMTENSM